MKKIILALLLVLNMGMTAEAALLPNYVTATYEVKAGDTLDSIAEMFITEEREFHEFREGIVELNYNEVFREREQSGEGDVVHEGDVLKIKHRKVFE